MQREKENKKEHTWERALQPAVKNPCKAFWDVFAYSWELAFKATSSCLGRLSLHC